MRSIVPMSAVAGLLCGIVQAQPLPVFPATNVPETFFGTRVDDPYRALENDKDPRVAAWMKAQSDHARAALEGLPGYAKLRSRIAELDNATAARVGDIQRIGSGEVFFLRRGASENTFKLLVRGTDGKRAAARRPRRLGEGNRSAPCDQLLRAVARWPHRCRGRFPGRQRACVALPDRRRGQAEDRRADRSRALFERFLARGQQVLFLHARPGRQCWSASQRELQEPALLPARGRHRSGGGRTSGRHRWQPADPRVAHGEPACVCPAGLELRRRDDL